MPTTYEAPSAATATPSDTSLPLPPHVVSDSSVWACDVAAAKATHTNPTNANSNTGIGEQRSAVEDVTDFSLFIGIWFFMVTSIILS
jgi:hypothetical protein